MAESRSLTLADPGATESFGGALAAAVRAERPSGLVVYLEGELGAGKTTLARGFLRAMGHPGRVPSPTYTLIEPYELAEYMVYHVDLYRIRSARELDDLGLADQLGSGSIALIEWPDHGTGHLPPADLSVRLAVMINGRRASVETGTVAGQRVAGQLVSSPYISDLSS